MILVKKDGVGGVGEGGREGLEGGGGEVEGGACGISCMLCLVVTLAATLHAA